MFENDSELFSVIGQESKARAKWATYALLYILLGIVVIVTGAHGIMLVLSETTADYFGAGTLATFLDLVRISFPVAVELAAIVAGLGFATGKWRAGQKSVGLAVEAVWVIFAACNMVTFFAIERGLFLKDWQRLWIDYGLPLSALLSGVLIYAMLRTDPDHRRNEEEIAAHERITMQQFAAKLKVMLSPQMQAIEKQKAWLEVVNRMRTAGYSDEQIKFLLADTPELMIDQNKNGRPDLLEGEQPKQLPPPAPSPELNGFRNHIDKRQSAESPAPLPFMVVRKAEENGRSSDNGADFPPTRQ